MISTNKDLRARAREELKGKWKNPVLVALIYFLICFVIKILSHFLITFHDLYFILASLAISLSLSGALIVGFINYFLNFIKPEKPSLILMFSGFNNFLTSLGIYLWFSLWLFIWSLLLIIPGIIKSLSYSLAFYIINENPKIGIRNALRMSQKMTYGYKMKIFLLKLSFLGWIILGALPLGIGLLWVIPYIQVSCTKQYVELKREAIENGTYTEDLFVDKEII